MDMSYLFRADILLTISTTCPCDPVTSGVRLNKINKFSELQKISQNKSRQIITKKADQQETLQITIDCIIKFKAYFKTTFNKEVNIMRVFRHKKLCILNWLIVQQKLQADNLSKAGFKIKKSSRPIGLELFSIFHPAFERLSACSFC